MVVICCDSSQKSVVHCVLKCDVCCCPRCRRCRRCTVILGMSSVLVVLVDLSGRYSGVSSCDLCGSVLCRRRRRGSRCRRSRL